MTLVVLGIDALDPELVGSTEYSNLTLAEAKAIDTIVSDMGAPSTHELWPTIITGLPPTEHGLVLDETGVAWGNVILNSASRVADYVLPDKVQTKLGAWLLTNVTIDAFQTPVTYYDEHNISTVFDDRPSKAIGIPNYVDDTNYVDREHALRKSLGSLFERTPGAAGGHRSDDPETFFNLCLEMAIVRVARTRAALRAETYELVFGYTSALDLVGHIAVQFPGMQEAMYGALNEFTGELRSDLCENDELVLVSDHGLQDGRHTDEAMIASTNRELLADVESVLDIRGALERELDASTHRPAGHQFE